MFFILRKTGQHKNNINIYDILTPIYKKKCLGKLFTEIDSNYLQALADLLRKPLNLFKLYVQINSLTNQKMSSEM